MRHGTFTEIGSPPNSPVAHREEPRGEGFLRFGNPLGMVLAPDAAENSIVKCPESVV